VQLVQCNQIAGPASTEQITWIVSSRFVQQFMVLVILAPPEPTVSLELVPVVEFVLVLVPEIPVLLSPIKPTSSFVIPICIAILPTPCVRPLSVLALLAHL